tara:strand:- start:335 stop:520 length:186 start_codon:yes stop_codon:yes gene_type:complete
VPLYQTKLTPEEALLVVSIINASNFPGTVVTQVAKVKGKMERILETHHEKTGEIVAQEPPA